MYLVILSLLLQAIDHLYVSCATEEMFNKLIIPAFVRKRQEKQ